MLAVTFHQNDNIRESAIQLPLVVDILQSKSCVGVPLPPCIFVRFFGVRIVLVPVSGQIELDDGLQNTIFHVGRRVAQVKAAGDPPVCFAVAGCLALDGDKVCGNVELRKIIFCNCGADGGDLEGCAVPAGLVGGCFLHTGDNGVFRARPQVGEMAAALPGRPIVYGILPGTVFCYFNVRIRPADQRNGGCGRLSRMLVGAGEVKRFVLGHLTEKLPFIFFVFQLELNLVNEVGRVFWILFMFATHVLVKFSFIDGIHDIDNNRPETVLLRDHRSRKAAGQLTVTPAFVGLCAGASDQIVWNCDARQIRCQIKCWRGFLCQCRRWEQRQHHAAEQQDAEKSFSHGLVPPFSL